MGKKKHICFIKEDITIKGGSERVACILMNELSKYFKISCISIKQKNKKIAYPLNEEIEICFLSKDSNRMRYQLFSLYFKYLIYIFTRKIDIILNIGMPGVAISFVSKLFSKRKMLISCEHSNLMNKIGNNSSKRKTQKLASLFSDKIITLTEKDKKNYIKKFNLHDNKVDYIYNFIEDNLLENSSKYNGNSKKIISVGRFDKVKGYDRLVDIAEILKGTDWEWHIYGDGDEMDNISSYIRKKKLEDKVILKGEVDNIYDVYQEYSFLVMTSYYEGLPMVLIEAKVNFLPLVSFDCETGPSEIIRDGIDGYLIENNSIEKMKEKILFLMNNPELRKEFSKNARGNIDKFKKEDIIKKWIKLLENI